MVSTGWSASERSGVPESTSQSLIVPSQLVEARALPSRENATVVDHPGRVVTREAADGLPGAGVPEDQLALGAGRCQAGAVRVEGDRVDRVAGGQGADQLAGGGVPDLDRPVMARGGHAAAVGTVREATDDIAMPRQGPPLRAGQAVEVVPLEAAQVGLPPRRPGLLEVAQHLPDVDVAPVALGQVERGRVGQVAGVVLAREGPVLAGPRQDQGAAHPLAGGEGLAPLPDDAADPGDHRDRQRADQRRDRGMAADAFPEPFPHRDGSREDRPPVEPSVQVLGQLARRGVAVLRLLPQAFQADRLQVGVDPGVPDAWARRLRVADGVDHLGVGVDPRTAAGPSTAYTGPRPGRRRRPPR